MKITYIYVLNNNIQQYNRSYNTKRVSFSYTRGTTAINSFSETFVFQR